MFCHSGDGLICGWCYATVVDGTTLVIPDVVVIFNGLNHFWYVFNCTRYNSYLMWMADGIAIVADVNATIPLIVLLW